MKFVQPIREPSKIFELLDYLKDWNPNYYLAAAIGINWGLRCSDILALTIGDVVVKGIKYVKIADEVRLIEIKNTHERIIPVAPEMKKYLRKHIEWIGYPDTVGVYNESPLVCSRQHSNGVLKPLSRKRLWEVLKTSARHLGIEDMGTHTLRKTYVYQAWKRGVLLDVIRKELGHASIEYTERYASIPLSMTREIYEKVHFHRDARPERTHKRKGARLAEKRA